MLKILTGCTIPAPNCVFPFKYQGRTFSKCTDYHSPNDKPWCATKVDRNSNVVWEQWTDCDNICPGGEATILGSRSGGPNSSSGNNVANFFSKISVKTDFFRGRTFCLKLLTGHCLNDHSEDFEIKVKPFIYCRHCMWHSRQCPSIK